MSDNVESRLGSPISDYPYSYERWAYALAYYLAASGLDPDDFDSVGDAIRYQNDNEMSKFGESYILDFLIISLGLDEKETKR